MEQYILKTTMEDGTVLVSSRFTNKAFKSISKEMKQAKISFDDLNDINSILSMYECFENAIAIMFERPYMGYCTGKGLPLEQHDINMFMDELMPNEVANMSSKVLNWYLEAFNELSVAEKNTKAPKATKQSKIKKDPIQAI